MCAQPTPANPGDVRVSHAERPRSIVLTTVMVGNESLEDHLFGPIPAYSSLF
jgi:hypothetical protein